MSGLKPFFCYFGGKYRAALKYPPPRFDKIIEPFAGAAGYSTRYHSKQVELWDTDERIAGLWDYLIRVPSAEVLRLPLEIPTVVSDLKVPQEAKWLIGFWINKGTSGPCDKPTTWFLGRTRPRSYWGTEIRGRIAAQVELIRHWKIHHGSYECCGDEEATWFVDPPYQKSGRHYRDRKIDYSRLSQWCACRRGQVIVCEQEGASWMPFRPFREIMALRGPRGKQRSKEVVWTN